MLLSLMPTTTLMASPPSTITIYQLATTALLLLSLCNNGTSHGSEFDRWVSWNARKHATKTIRTQSSSSSSSSSLSLDIGTDETQVLDVKLRLAERNRYRVVVRQDGGGNYTTVGAAVAAIPNGNKRRVILEIGPGVYREKISIPRSMPFVTLLGDPLDPPTITGNDTASAVGKNGVPLRTLQSATVAVEANYFVAINIIFENTAPHEVGTRGEQAVALRISGTKASFYNCSFYGAQDTLYDHKGLHYFHNCFIQGSVDFIFGHGRSLYEKCQLNSIGKKVSSLTAQKRTNSTLESGFSFKDSVVTGSGRVYLGRAWGDYSRVVFSFTFMDKTVHPQGWNDWGHQNRDFRVYYGEYKCSGPGANSTARVPWARMLTDEEALPFIGTYYVDGQTWLIPPPS